MKTAYTSADDLMTVSIVVSVSQVNVLTPRTE